MTEAQFQTRLLKALRAHPALAGWKEMIWKVSDRFGGGRPDIQIFTGRTNYFELKVAPEAPTKIQYFFLKRLGARGHWVQFYQNGRHILYSSNSAILLFGVTMNELADAIVYRCVNE